MKNNKEQTPGTRVSLSTSARLPLSTNTITYVADLLRAHLKAIGSRWRSKTAGQIAVLVLAVLRHDQRAADLAGGNDVSATTIRRWTDEVVALLAAKAPRLDRALKKITRAGDEVVLLDGTLDPHPPPLRDGQPPRTIAVSTSRTACCSSPSPTNTAT